MSLKASEDKLLEKKNEVMLEAERAKTTAMESGKWLQEAVIECLISRAKSGEDKDWKSVRRKELMGAFDNAKTETEPANEEAEPEPLPLPEEPADSTDEPDPGLIPEVPSEPSASVEKRHLVHRPRLGRYGIGIQAYRFTARRSGRDLYRRARGNRIWKRKRNRGRVLRRIRKDKR